MRRHGCAPSGSDTERAVEDCERGDRQICDGLNRRAVVVTPAQEVVVFDGKQETRDGGEASEDVACRCRVLAALGWCENAKAKISGALSFLPLARQYTHQQARSELSEWLQKRDVVRTREVLRHADDRCDERRLAVVIGCVLGNVAGELRDLNFGAHRRENRTVSCGGRWGRRICAISDNL